MYPAKERGNIFDVIEREEFDIVPYCPMVKATTMRNGLVKMVEKPIYLNYMFWKYSHIDLPMRELKKYMKFRILIIGDEYAVLNRDEVKRIRRIEKRENVRFSRVRKDADYLKRFIGSLVSIRDGVFNGMVGKVVGVVRVGMLSVELTIFNRPVTCEISVEYTEIVKP